jgi:hypothetical protein
VVSVLDSRALGVVVGLAGIYLALSMVVLCVVEMISSLRSSRAQFIRDAIRNLVGNELGVRVLNHPLVSSLGFVRASGAAEGLPSYVPSGFFARAVIAELEKAPDDPALVPVKELLDAVVGNPDASLAEVEHKIAVWFDAAMDRLSGAFKRHTQTVAVILTVVLVAGGNIDSIRLVKTLWRDAGAQTQIEALARDELKACDTDRQSAECVDVLKRYALRQEIPMGWNRAEVERLDASGWIQRICGLLLTVLAVSRGAPFWFDALKRLSTGLVSSGPPPARAAPVAAAGATPTMNVASTGSRSNQSGESTPGAA